MGDVCKRIMGCGGSADEPNKEPVVIEIDVGPARLRPCKHRCSGKMIRDDESEVPLDPTKIKLKNSGEIAGKIKFEEYGKCAITGRWNRHKIQIFYEVDYGGETGVYKYEWNLAREEGVHFTGEYNSDQGSHGKLEIDLEPKDHFSSSDEFSDGGYLYGPSKVKVVGKMVREDKSELPIEKTKLKLHKSGRVTGKIVYEEYGKSKVSGTWDGEQILLKYDVDFGGETGVYNYEWDVTFEPGHDSGSFVGSYKSEQGSVGFLYLDVIDVDEFSDSGCSEEWSDDGWDW